MNRSPPPSVKTNLYTGEPAQPIEASAEGEPEKLEEVEIEQARRKEDKEVMRIFRLACLG